MSFHGKVVIVTGAGMGIGRAIAKMYAERGAKVVIADSDEHSGQQVEKDIISGGRDASFCMTDVREPEEVDRLIEYTIGKYEAIDILVNNAGVSRFQSPFELSVEEWDEMLNINLRGYFLCARAAAWHMKDSGGGSIINIASTRAMMSEPNSEAYAASKGGIIALSHALAASFSEFGIRVNAISPGWIETGNYDLLSERDHEQHFSKRVGKPEDIARACLFLSEEENDFVTGTNLVVDGGMTRKMIYEE